MPKDLWGNEIVVEPKPIKKKTKRQSTYYNVGRSKPVSTDITLWFGENKPKTLAECADLRRALKTKSSSKIGNYTVDVSGPKGMKTTYVCGPAGEVALKAAARKLFNRLTSWSRLSRFTCSNSERMSLRSIVPGRFKI